MPRTLIDLGGRPLLDIASYARRGPGQRERLSPAEIEIIARTVRRTPEVMVKVLSRGGQDLGAVRRHLAYLNRGGELELETDDGQRLSGKGVEKSLLEDWDLDLEEHRRRSDLDPRARSSSPKLVHKLLFSMPPGTPPEKVLEAVKNFAREEFALKHRYTMVLHTDEPHPHVHMVLKAVSESGERLNIKKAHLRRWRREFAHRLRQQGIEANATERQVRGQIKATKRDSIYRAAARGVSTLIRKRVRSVAMDLLKGKLQKEPGKTKLEKTRREVEGKWNEVIRILGAEGHLELAAHVREFVSTMPPPQTDNEQIAATLFERTKEPHERVRPTSR
jgi:hypothetical protein